MENQDVELRRFRQKARGYRAAHELAPAARILEVFAVAGIVEGYRRKKGLSRGEIIVVDLMAGTGFLCDWLYRLGFRRLHALEACNEMSQGPSEKHDDRRHYDLHPIASADGIAPLLKRIQPHVIVCFAGFHHLIEYEPDGKTVNVSSSVDLQRRVARVCMDAVGEDGMLLIVDIYDDALKTTDFAKWPYWQKGKTFTTLLKDSAIPESIKVPLLEASSFQEFSITVEKHLGGVPKKQNPSLSWFRQVVDAQSAAGHKDIALSNQLLDSLALAYRVSFVTTLCPWVFFSRATLQKFLVTFWFDDANQDVQKISQILAAAERINGLNTNGTYASFGWNLGFAVVEARNGGVLAVSRAARRRMVLLFWALLAFSVINVFLKLLSYWSNLYGFIDGLIPGVLGVILGEGMGEWQRRTERRESDL